MKKIRKFLSLTKVLAAVVFLPAGLTVSTSAQTCQPVAPDLVSWWSGDGNALDPRSRNNGTLNGSYTSGQIGDAFEFNGNNNSILVGNHSSLQPASITVETWILKYGTPANVIENIFAKWGFDARLDSYLFGVYQDGRRLRVFGAIGDGVTGDNGFKGGSVRLNLWTHLAMTYNAADGFHKLYVDGAEVASRYRPGGIFPTTSKAYFGREDSANQRYFWGRIDELAIYSRALSAGEIQAVYNAGAAGKCKTTATQSPYGIAGFWGGDGRTNDYFGFNNPATLINGANFAIGKVGQGFNLDGYDDAVYIPHHHNQNINGDFSGEGWIYPRGFYGSPRIMATGGTGANTWLLYLANPAQPQMVLQINDPLNGGLQFTTPAGSIALDQWNHVAFTLGNPNAYSTVNLYINGVNAVSAAALNKQTVNNGNGLYLGLGSFNGIIDEASIYQRELTAADIESVYNAGRAGKLKSVVTVPSGLFNGTMGDATVYIPNVTSGGTTQVIPLEPNAFPALPPGRSPTGLFYDVATSASFAGNPSVCFEVPSFAAQFFSLRILKFENGGWVDVTGGSNIYPALCTSALSTLSPMAIVY